MKTKEQKVSYMQMWDLTDKEWMKLPKKEILQLYKNCYTMLQKHFEQYNELVKTESVTSSNTQDQTWECPRCHKIHSYLHLTCDCLPYVITTTTWDESYLNECIKKATPNLSKIKDVDKTLDEIKGVTNLKDELLKFNSWMCHNEFDGRIPMIGKCIDEYLQFLNDKNNGSGNCC